MIPLIATIALVICYLVFDIRREFTKLNNKNSEALRWVKEQVELAEYRENENRRTHA